MKEVLSKLTIINNLINRIETSVRDSLPPVAQNRVFFHNLFFAPPLSNLDEYVYHLAKNQLYEVWEESNIYEANKNAYLYDSMWEDLLINNLAKGTSILNESSKGLINNLETSLKKKKLLLNKTYNNIISYQNGFIANNSLISDSNDIITQNNNLHIKTISSGFQGGKTTLINAYALACAYSICNYTDDDIAPFLESIETIFEKDDLERLPILLSGKYIFNHPFEKIIYNSLIVNEKEETIYEYLDIISETNKICIIIDDNTFCFDSDLDTLLNILHQYLLQNKEKDILLLLTLDAEKENIEDSLLELKKINSQILFIGSLDISTIVTSLNKWSSVFSFMNIPFDVRTLSSAITLDTIYRTILQTPYELWLFFLNLLKNESDPSKLFPFLYKNTSNIIKKLFCNTSINYSEHDITKQLSLLTHFFQQSPYDEHTIDWLISSIKEIRLSYKGLFRKNLSNDESDIRDFIELLIKSHIIKQINNIYFFSYIYDSLFHSILIKNNYFHFSNKATYIRNSSLHPFGYNALEARLLLEIDSEMRNQFLRLFFDNIKEIYNYNSVQVIVSLDIFLNEYIESIYREVSLKQLLKQPRTIESGKFDICKILNKNDCFLNSYIILALEEFHPIPEDRVLLSNYIDYYNSYCLILLYIILKKFVSDNTALDYLTIISQNHSFFDYFITIHNRLLSIEDYHLFLQRIEQLIHLSVDLETFYGSKYDFPMDSIVLLHKLSFFLSEIKGIPLSFDFNYNNKKTFSEKAYCIASLQFVFHKESFSFINNHSDPKQYKTYFINIIPFLDNIVEAILKDLLNLHFDSLNKELLYTLISITENGFYDFSSTDSFLNETFFELCVHEGFSHPIIGIENRYFNLYLQMLSCFPISFRGKKLALLKDNNIKELINIFFWNPLAKNVYQAFKILSVLNGISRKKIPLFYNILDYRFNLINLLPLLSYSYLNLQIKQIGNGVFKFKKIKKIFCAEDPKDGCVKYILFSVVRNSSENKYACVKALKKNKTYEIEIIKPKRYQILALTPYSGDEIKKYVFNPLSFQNYDYKKLITDLTDDETNDIISYLSLVNDNNG